jgi:hypothetical protein
MAKDPAFLFYSNDFLTGTYLMSDEQVGKYIRLLCLQHQKGQLSKKDMLHICKTYDKDIFDKFTEKEDFYFNERLLEESTKRKSYSESRKNNRKSKDMNNICKTYDKHMENENENEDVIINTSYNTKPKNLDFKELPEIKIGSAIELLSITKKVKATKEQIIGLWEVFKVQNLTGDNYYPSEDKVYSHFINWVKTQNFKDADNKKPLNEQRFDAYVEYANRHS